MKLTDPAVRSAADAELSELSEVVAQGLVSRPLGAWLVPAAAGRPGVLWRYARLVLKRGVRYGRVDTTDDHAAVAIWYSRREPPTPGAEWMYDLQRFLGADAARFALLHAYVDAVLPHTPHHYLAHLAVRPGQEAAARALLASYHRVADEEGLPAYAEVASDNPRESVLAGLGYEPRSPILLEPGGPMLWRMWRPAPDERLSALPRRVRLHRAAMPFHGRVIAMPRSP
ncbi:N-acetyltransferase [Micromonospora sp. WMMD718]|uniref:hypothetical protein n=1 Tax=unclassified Micromonospora TaxID=2617518 RepID=UPI00064B8F00|nr:MULTISPECIES: hypothetical protein [unclassified Micromonospora]MDG4751295.1 N-acetyltransferase [Micromonospora sp. WMMD718]